MLWLCKVTEKTKYDKKSLAHVPDLQKKDYVSRAVCTFYADRRDRKFDDKDFLNGLQTHHTCVPVASGTERYICLSTKESSSIWQWTKKGCTGEMEALFSYFVDVRGTY